MTKEDIIRMADKSGIHASIAEANIKLLERFAALVAAHEREECAKLCETYFKHHPANYRSVAGNCAEIIRERYHVSHVDEHNIKNFLLTVGI